MCVSIVTDLAEIEKDVVVEEKRQAEGEADVFKFALEQELITEQDKARR